MRTSTDKILTTHVGSLPGPADAWGRSDVSEHRLREVVRDVVKLQKDAGIDLVNEGELTKEGSWVSFMAPRLTGFEPVAAEVGVTQVRQRADRVEFADFYAAAAKRGTLFEQTGSTPEADTADRRVFACTGPIRYVGQAALQTEIDVLKAALGDTPAQDAFLTSVAPSSFEPVRGNHYYESQEAYVFALAEAMAAEYEAIAESGLVVQVDDAFLASLWESIGLPMGVEAYRRYCRVRVEALNHALRNIPPEQVRYHLCWGSWHGPHAYDLPLKDIIDILLEVRAGAYLIEAANVRHEHEYRLWETVKLPAGKILMPGVVSHATTLIEHPELVSERIQRFARVVGTENVVASTDCGLGMRCHPQIAVAKLKALSQGAALASKALFRKPQFA